MSTPEEDIDWYLLPSIQSIKASQKELEEHLAQSRATRHYMQQQLEDYRKFILNAREYLKHARADGNQHSDGL